MTPYSQSVHPPLPFNARAARILREKLGMAPGHVAYGMRASYGTAHITPDHITAWERGTALPTASELTALAGALWCNPRELMGAPRTLREHRLARRLAAEDVARATGLTLGAYHHMEETDQWTGDKRQSAKLGSLLNLPHATSSPSPASRTNSPASSPRPSPPAGRPTSAPSPASSPWNAATCKTPCATCTTSTRPSWPPPSAEPAGTTASGENGRRYIDDIVNHFWARLPED